MSNSNLHESQAFAILGTGSYAPERILTNADLSRMVDTSDEWITERTGIKERRIAAETQASSDLAVEAGKRAMEAAGISPEQIDLLIVASVTPDYPLPSTACIVQSKLGIPANAACFDLNAACSGFIYALDTAWAMLASGRYHHALVIATEKLSSIIDWKDRSTCILFGDGAGAAVIGPAREGSTSRLIASKLYAEGNYTDLLIVPAGGSRHPHEAPDASGPRRYVSMQGSVIFKHAVRQMGHAAAELLKSQGLTPDDVDLFISHQANKRIVDALMRHLSLPPEKVFVNLGRYGNTSAASVPIALDEAIRSGRLKPGNVALLVAFGAGLTYGASLLRC